MVYIFIFHCVTVQTWPEIMPSSYYPFMSLIKIKKIMPDLRLVQTENSYKDFIELYIFIK